MSRSRRIFVLPLWNGYELSTCAELFGCAITPQLQSLSRRERRPHFSLRKHRNTYGPTGTGFPAGAICALRYLNCVLPASIETHHLSWPAVCCQLRSPVWIRLRPVLKRFFHISRFFAGTQHPTSLPESHSGKPPSLRIVIPSGAQRSRGTCFSQPSKKLLHFDR